MSSMPRETVARLRAASVEQNASSARRLRSSLLRPFAMFSSSQRGSTGEPESDEVSSGHMSQRSSSSGGGEDVGVATQPRRGIFGSFSRTSETSPSTTPVTRTRGLSPTSTPVTTSRRSLDLPPRTPPSGSFRRNLADLAPKTPPSAVTGRRKLTEMPTKLTPPMRTRTLGDQPRKSELRSGAPVLVFPSDINRPRKQSMEYIAPKKSTTERDERGFLDRAFESAVTFDFDEEEEA